MTTHNLGSDPKQSRMKYGSNTSLVSAVPLRPSRMFSRSTAKAPAYGCKRSQALPHRPAGCCGSGSRYDRLRAPNTPAATVTSGKKPCLFIWPTMCRPKNPSQHWILTGKSLQVRRDHRRMGLPRSSQIFRSNPLKVKSGSVGPESNLCRTPNKKSVRIQPFRFLAT